MCSSCGGKKSSSKKTTNIFSGRPTHAATSVSRPSASSTFGTPKIKFGSRSR